MGLERLLGQENATYDGQDIVQSNLHLIARDRRISFNDQHKVAFKASG